MSLSELRCLLYDMDEETLLRRMGGAVASQWGNLPPAVQDLIFAQACRMFDREPVDDLEHRLYAFIARYRID